MKQNHVWIPALALALLAYGTSRAATAPMVLPAVRSEAPVAAEVARIQAHLEEVERELLARDVSDLTPAQREARARHIAVLREYREAGVFPHNHDFPGEFVPYFVDEHGTLCAMAYLIARSGGDDLVRRVAESRNNARIAELADEPELLAWLEEAGLSVAEAARIQPAYGGGGCCWVGPGDDSDRLSGEEAVASVVSAGFSGAAIALNLGRSADAPRWPGLVGVLAGAAGIAVGADAIGEGGARGTVGLLTAGLGTTSAALGAWTLARPARDAAGEDVTVPRGSAARTVTASPILPVPASGNVIGLMLRMRF